MKILSMFLFAFFVLLNTLTLNAQNCRVIDNPSLPAVPNSSFGDLSKLSLYQPTQVRTIFIAAHIVRSSSGTGGISTNDIATSIQQLNTAYTDVMIQFVHNQTDYIDNDTYYNLAEDDYSALIAINNVSNKINVYYVSSATRYDGVAIGGLAAYVSNSCAVTNAVAIDGSSLAHEIGHDFYLFHTHGNSTQELVNQSNCNSAGDYLCDTPAEPYNGGDGISGYIFTNTCGYFGTFRDANNQLFTPDTRNFMGYSLPSCKNHFSSLQIQKINETIDTYFPHLLNSSVVLSNKINGNIITNEPNVRPSTLTVVGVTTVNSGSSANLSNGNGYDIKTNQERFPNFSTYGNIKHNNWNSEAAKFKLSENYVVKGTFRDANFQSLKYSLIQGRAESATNAGSFQFQDPWYVKSDGTQPGNYWIPCTATYEPNGKEGATEKGVFLSQGYNISGQPYYSVKVDAEQNVVLSQTGKTHKFYFQNWSATGANFQNANALETPVVFTSEGATVQANLKGTQLSNNASAFTNTSQRKLVRTKDNWMHQVYESMGHVWIEHSTNNGSTWFLGNNGQPLDTVGGKCPSIDWHFSNGAPNNSNYYAFIVVYQQPSGSVYTIEFAVFKYTSGSYVRQGQSDGPLYTEPTGGDQYSSTNANPNITWGSYDRFVLTFERKSTAGSMQPGIYWIAGKMYELGLESVLPEPCAPVKITGTTSSSINAAVSINKLCADPSDFDIVYQTAASAPASIVDVILTCSESGSSWVTSQVGTYTLSSSTGYLNTKPSVVQMPDNNIRAAWVRNMYNSSSQPSTVNTVYWNSASPSVYTYAGNGVNSVSLNIKDDNTNTYYAYAQNTNNSSWQNFATNNSSTITLNTTGRDIQLSNGSSSSNMYASAYYTASLPYYFLTTNSLSSLTKSSGEEYTYGRGVILSKDDMGFSYSIKSLKVDETPVKFTEIPESEVQGDSLVKRSGVQPLGLDSLNTLLISEPFTIGEGTTLSFSEGGGFNTTEETADTSEVEQAGNYINCTVELIEDGTNLSLGVIKQVQYTPADEQESDLSLSNINMSSLNGKTVRLKLTLATNIADMQGLFVDEYNTVNDDMLQKLGAEDIALQGEGIITDYALEQNYPNPFNPTTTINYQLPSDGIVTIKIYDALGSEVKTLVNEVKQKGKYTVTFNASSLASGVYFYRINVNDYTATKKLMLMK